MKQLDEAIAYYKTSSSKNIHIAKGEVINMHSLLLELKLQLGTNNRITNHSHQVPGVWDSAHPDVVLRYVDSAIPCN